MTEQTTKAITYDISDVYGCTSGTQTRLYLIPSEETENGSIQIYLWSHVGSGMPAMAWHSRWFYIGSPGTTFEAKSLIEALKTNEDTFREIDEQYLGSKWDGHNTIGQWTDYAKFDNAEEWTQIGVSARESCNHYWSADEWFSSSLNDIDLSKESIHAIAEWESGKADGAILKTDDCETFLRHMLTQRAEELREIEEPDEDETSELANIERLLAT